MMQVYGSYAQIMKQDEDIAYIAMRKIHYNIMRFRDTLSCQSCTILDIIFFVGLLLTDF